MAARPRLATYDPTLPAEAAAFRRFNRLYTYFLGTLSEGFLRTEFSLAEGRVLYELATRRPAAKAKEIGEALGMDAGYLSRILTQFEKSGLITRRPSQRDGRASDLQLTTRGRTVFRTLNTRAEKQARDFLRALPLTARAEFSSALGTMQSMVEQSLSGEQPPPLAWTLRTHRSGDMGMVVALEGAGYVDQFGWDSTFEGLVARIVSDFIDHFNPERERCWIAEIPDLGRGRHVGHIFLVQHPEQPDTAKLRLLYVDPSARGLGLGQALVDECVRFARESGYRKIVLWTQSILTAAHRLYQNAGFCLVEEQRHHSFGKDLIGQNWELDLR
jgi:DNA-binding MarR family transcriptional regulator/GNAT superfamily N-acetyltransferase